MCIGTLTIVSCWLARNADRRARNGTSYVAFTTNTTEPKPTGYLNVYEYDLAATNFSIQVGDVLNISWHGDVPDPFLSCL